MDGQTVNTNRYVYKRRLLKCAFADDLEWPLKVISANLNGVIVCISKIQHIVYEVDYNGQTSYVSNYFYCRIPPEGLLWCWARTVTDS